jgi:hypothetical protein
MQTRRSLLGALPGALVLIGSGSAVWAGDDALPSAKLVAGTPPVLDYGGGVKVPCNKDAFFTLWESDAFWLTFGFGISPVIDISKIRAEKQASGVMKFMLLTLAFAPERLVKVEGGWRKKNPTAHDFVIGDLTLPIQHSKSMSDAFLGGGNVVIDPMWDHTSPPIGMSAPQPGGIDPAPGGFGPLANARQATRYAFTASVVLKKDMSLDDVRKHAVVLQL